MNKLKLKMGYLENTLSTSTTEKNNVKFLSKLLLNRMNWSGRNVNF